MPPVTLCDVSRSPTAVVLSICIFQDKKLLEGNPFLVFMLPISFNIYNGCIQIQEKHKYIYTTTHNSIKKKAIQKSNNLSKQTQTNFSAVEYTITVSRLPMLQSQYPFRNQYTQKCCWKERHYFFSAFQMCYNGVSLTPGS